ncbi:hypothetical protein B5G06_05245 [Flavonifractor sp. An52]|nr:hypothetical protein B5G06_05245 [Flavonifractor sp. An52]
MADGGDLRRHDPGPGGGPVPGRGAKTGGQAGWRVAPAAGSGKALDKPGRFGPHPGHDGIPPGRGILCSGAGGGE